MQVFQINSGARVVPASMVVRTFALLIDIALLVFVAAVADYYTISSNDTSFLWKPEALIYILLGWLYFAGTESSSAQATLGKYLLGIQVVDKYNSRLTFKNASIRYFARPISLVVLLMRFVRGLPVARHRYFHNKVAQAFVIKSRH